MRDGTFLDGELSEALQFQSTRPLRDGTLYSGTGNPVMVFQSTRPLRDGTFLRLCRSLALIFQSTRPLRDGTGLRRGRGSDGGISIHPPLAGRDVQCPQRSRTHRYFNPPAPCGTGRKISQFAEMYGFISIHPPLAGRDGPRGTYTEGMITISIHPHCQSDSPQQSSQNFNPPAPCGTGPPPHG